MDSNFFLTEKDYFDYVFNRSTLTAEVIARIENDPASKEKTEYYQSLKTFISEEEDLTREIISKIAARIPAFREEGVIELYPLQTSDAPYAGSGRPHRTFADAQKNYFVHLEEISTDCKVWLFSPVASMLSKFRLTFLPSGNAVVREDNLDAAVISRQDTIDRIRLEF